jgi:parvulin-like peptidyl-prolyl isomerase
LVRRDIWQFSFRMLSSSVYGETAMARVETPKLKFELSLKWKRRLAYIACAVAVVIVCVVLRGVTGSRPAEAQIQNLFRSNKASESAPAQQAAGGANEAQHAVVQMPRPERPKHDVMAVVNGQDIRRDALATACVERFGEEVLEGLMNKRLIVHHCRNRQITVTDAEIDAEIDRMAARFKIGREQWLQMLQRERGINVEQYKHDILWPTLALRKCAADKLTVTDEQLQQAYESQFGPAVKCRLIVVNDRQQAEQIRKQLIAQPADFPRLAMQHSVDVNSASIGGLIQPIRRHVGDPAIEREVFAMQPNTISSIIPIGNQFAILKCEGHEPARNVPMENVRDELAEQIREGKLRDVASTLFKELQDASTPQNVWNDPQLRAQMPGVVALINGEQIRYQELAEECLLRYGEQVLEVEISHLLLHQSLKSANLTVTEQDINAEIAHAAELSGVMNAQGKPDIEKWMRMATEEQGISKDQYLRDSVWPSAALKKLTSGSISVTPDDLQKGFDANYSQRVRCRAIVLSSMRRAQEVWAKARENSSMDYFGDLAAEYSIEPSSKSLRGEVPPIRRYGGQPQLEEVAFELQPGELSGIVQIGDKFVILKCEGRTEPIEVNQQEVRDILYQDIFEKKLRLAMNEKFEAIRSQARIDNYLAGTSQAPERVKEGKSTDTPHMDSAVRATSGPPARQVVRE